MISIALYSPAQVFPRPPDVKIIIDANGNEVAVPQPFQGIIPGPYLLYGVLQKIHRPGALVNFAVRKDFSARSESLINWIYPSLFLESFSYDIETILAKDLRIYLYWCRSDLDRFGLASPAVFSLKPDTVFIMTEILNSIVDH
ncbi:MAG: hypothetical protein LBP22_05545 [Deltaproteobacteria bacterium]|nr:hypothetical protein [Deltaproteobacteria bacterium]